MEIPSDCPYRGLCTTLSSELELSNLSWRELRGLVEEGKELLLGGDPKFEICRGKNGFGCVINREFCRLLTEDTDPKLLLFSELRKRNVSIFLGEEKSRSL